MAHPEIELARKNALRDALEAAQTRTGRQKAYLEEYEFRGDGGDYTPSETDLVLIEDVIEGLLADDEWLAAVLRTEQNRQLLRGLPE